MPNVLIISGHPNLAASVGNITILLEVARALPGAEIRCLDTLYPDFKINVAAEQEALLKADVIVWQFPFSWYSLPGIMKLWLDEVFVHGFAHGSTAKLGGKKLILSFTTGAPQALYSSNGFFGNDVEDYLIQFETTAALCNLDMQKPVYTCGVSYSDRDETKIAQQKIMAKEHASRLVTVLLTLSSEPEMVV
ncbi:MULTISPECIES: NAD(P)H-dependent oxidoreductase [Symbiopectobacterium]|uniref:NAD(P)H-dependent oxidoreductase n=1 Tax=Symbiopectobacterium TaxID=801 RepID=UPI001A25E409|nr:MULTISPECIES: NAD(P)H-dependent oxidoreductase [Symbiopectobacterium]MBG6248763.1 flavodoxin family protein [Candidatus Symbiopectobacterium sp. PLON1]MBT9428993.1 NAD(P)H-dependent oxidoreductase [Candidatus Symbiopectobacterium endolongispinus]